MVKRKLPRSVERNLLIRVNSFLEGKVRTSTKKIFRGLSINPTRAGHLLRELGWIKHRRNGASGTVYVRPSSDNVHEDQRGNSYTLAPGKHEKS